MWEVTHRCSETSLHNNVVNICCSAEFMFRCCWMFWNTISSTSWTDLKTFLWWHQYYCCCWLLNLETKCTSAVVVAFVTSSTFFESVVCFHCSRSPASSTTNSRRIHFSNSVQHCNNSPRTKHGFPIPHLHSSLSTSSTSFPFTTTPSFSVFPTEQTRRTCFWYSRFCLSPTPEIQFLSSFFSPSRFQQTRNQPVKIHPFPKRTHVGRSTIARFGRSGTTENCQTWIQILDLSKI